MVRGLSGAALPKMSEMRKAVMLDGRANYRFASLW